MITCDLCKQEFEPARPDEEAMAECRSYFGNVLKEELAVVCDDCWEKIRPEKNQEWYGKWKDTRIW
jgi:hypothetical protein